MSAEALARMSGGTMSLEFIPGGVPTLTMEEIMGSMAGLPRFTDLLLRVSLCGQNDSLPDLYREGFLLSGGLAVKNNWKPVAGKPVLRNMAVMAIDEIVDKKSYYCASCGGTGIGRDKAGNAIGKCNSCDGRGTLKPSGRDCAKKCEISQEAWRKTWAPRFLIVRDEIHACYWKGVSHVNKKING